jgi:hypothetical protein
VGVWVSEAILRTPTGALVTEDDIVYTTEDGETLVIE